MSHSITIHLKGGLGNQMFQYAFARTIAYNNNSELYVDHFSGFIRDKVYKRNFELSGFQISAKKITFIKSVPFWINKILRKVTKTGIINLKSNFLFYDMIYENNLNFINDAVKIEITKRTFIEGFWQSEKYFDNIKHIIAKELSPPTPSNEVFLKLALLINSCNSVCIGVRLFEEVPGLSKEGVGGLTEIDFFNNSAHKIQNEIENPEFFVFCTNNSSELDKLVLPGKTHFITHDNGFRGTIERLWLLTQCKNHIIANSSFYWWGAWLSEIKNDYKYKIIASPLFSNSDTVPKRWL
jgi:hypothetical protein